MLYTFVKYLVRAGLLIYCRKIVFTNGKVLEQKGPLLLACNHPNSFFDAILLGAFFKRPVHFLARGDAFKNTLAKKVLTALKLIPIYRLKEGKENLALNDATFERCADILLNGGIVLIFSEGLCENKWQLRPLKKGSARIALNVWKQPSMAEKFGILPVSFNYSSFTRFRKRVIIDFGKPVLKSELTETKNEAEQIIELNQIVYTRLEKGLLIEKNSTDLIEFLLNNQSISKDNLLNVMQNLKEKQRVLSTIISEKIRKLAGTKKVSLNKTSALLNLLVSIILFGPAIIALIVHLPVYPFVNYSIKKKTNGTVFYHSALFGVLIIIYPVYVFVISATLVFFFNKLFLLTLLLVAPALAMVFLLWKDCTEAAINYFRLSGKERLKIQQAI